MEAVKKEEIKKGPWKAEEDEVLINHVNRYGPRDWSSIRSKGLLQRTGKSCRLRWVNKLRPNLKRKTRDELDDFKAWFHMFTLFKIRKAAMLEMQMMRGADANFGSATTAEKKLEKLQEQKLREKLFQPDHT
ncbi:hypothetical protein DY000_02061829 [Brassica cretica]|uniref:HTH myb-type domain-containing protein n=1 Tax=Brassica cretica TaxID=69181 RepID=A0ABQ7ASU8_BRACR|nr:hypothetical protein DY000_02061829 [Brassica cretica]